MMKFSIQNPSEELSDYVRFFWTLDAKAESMFPFVHRALPDNCLELIFYCHGKFSISSSTGEEGNTFSSGVFGHAQKFRQFKTDSDFTLFGVYLYPHTFKTLFNLPAHELANQMVDSETLWGTEGKILEEKIMLAANDTIRADIFSDFLFHRIRNKVPDSRESGFIGTLKKIVSNNSVLSIPSFASDCNLSRRQFERKFKDFSGFSPKDFFRIIRFKNVLKESAQRNKSLAQIAIDSGYYDQSHFTHEFKKYSGYSPKEFFIHCPEATDSRATRDFKT
jgi:AraC-like DNA-binding protein